MLHVLGDRSCVLLSAEPAGLPHLTSCPRPRLSHFIALIPAVLISCRYNSPSNVMIPVFTHCSLKLPVGSRAVHWHHLRFGPRRLGQLGAGGMPFLCLGLTINILIRFLFPLSLILDWGQNAVSFKYEDIPNFHASKGEANHDASRSFFSHHCHHSDAHSLQCRAMRASWCLASWAAPLSW